MNEIILAFLSLSILAYHAWYTHEAAKEKKQLIDALIARSATELRDLRVAENTRIKVEPKRQGEVPDLIPLDQVDDDDLLKAMKETYGK